MSKFNEGSVESKIDSLVVPGLATGFGGTAASRCAILMRLALNGFMDPARIPSFDEIDRLHKKLVSA